jgi:hypothetical protein
MTKSLQILLAVTVLYGAVFLQPLAEAAEVNVTWTNPDEYRDIHAGNGSKKHFRKTTFKELEKHISKLAKKLPDNQKLEIEVTNIDLAGDVNIGGVRQLRIIKDIYYPRFEFEFKLLAADDTIILTKKENIKDMGFMVHNHLKYRNQSLGFEKQLLDEWFQKAFKK